MLYESVKSVLKRINELSPDLIMRSLLSQESDLEEVIIDLNTQDQLFDQGIDSEGVELSTIGGNYAPVTIAIKRTKGQPFNRITLNDTGVFYDSFDVTFESGGFIIEANTIKDGVDLTDRWGDNILGLTDESVSKLVFFLTPLIVEFIQNYILQDSR